MQAHADEEEPEIGQKDPEMEILDRLCLLDEIEINALGQCEGCIIVSLPKGYLETRKKEQLLHTSNAVQFNNLADNLIDR